MRADAEQCIRNDCSGPERDHRTDLIDEVLAIRPRAGHQGHLVTACALPSMLSEMSGVQEYVVSSSGQMSLPASARHRWALDGGGPVDVIDLGFGVLTVPKGSGRRLLDDLLSRDEHAAFVRSLADDPDLATT